MHDRTEDAATPQVGERGSSVWRSLAAILATFVILWFSLTTATSATIGALFAVGFAGFAAPVIVAVLAAAVTTFVVRSLTQQLRPFSAVGVTVMAVGIQTAWYFDAGELPIWWVQPGFELTHVISAAVAATALGIALGPLWLRLVGAVAAVGALVLLASLLAPDPPPVVEDTAQQQIDANYEYYIEQGIFPYTTDAPGSEVVGVFDYGPKSVLITTASGGVVEIITDRTPTVDKFEAWPCWFISDPNMGLEDTDVLADYSEWCAADAAGWTRVDGLGRALPMDGGLVAVKSADQYLIGLSEGTRPGIAAEVDAIASSLRMMTEAEVRAAPPLAR